MDADVDNNNNNNFTTMQMIIFWIVLILLNVWFYNVNSDSTPISGSKKFIEIDTIKAAITSTVLIISVFILIYSDWFKNLNIDFILKINNNEFIKNIDYHKYNISSLLYEFSVPIICFYALIFSIGYAAYAENEYIKGTLGTIVAFIFLKLIITTIISKYKSTEVTADVDSQSWLKKIYHPILAFITGTLPNSTFVTVAILFIILVNLSIYDYTYAHDPKNTGSKFSFAAAFTMFIFFGYIFWVTCNDVIKSMFEKYSMPSVWIYVLLYIIGFLSTCIMNAQSNNIMPQDSSYLAYLFSILIPILLLLLCIQTYMLNNSSITIEDVLYLSNKPAFFSFLISSILVFLIAMKSRESNESNKQDDTSNGFAWFIFAAITVCWIISFFKKKFFSFLFIQNWVNKLNHPLFYIICNLLFIIWYIGIYSNIDHMGLIKKKNYKVFGYMLLILTVLVLFSGQLDIFKDLKLPSLVLFILVLIIACIIIYFYNTTVAILFGSLLGLFILYALYKYYNGINFQDGFSSFINNAMYSPTLAASQLYTMLCSLIKGTLIFFIEKFLLFVFILYCILGYYVYSKANVTVKTNNCGSDASAAWATYKEVNSISKDQNGTKVDDLSKQDDKDLNQEYCDGNPDLELHVLQAQVKNMHDPAKKAQKAAIQARIDAYTPETYNAKALRYISDYKSISLFLFVFIGFCMLGIITMGYDTFMPIIKSFVLFIIACAFIISVIYGVVSIDNKVPSIMKIGMFLINIFILIGLMSFFVNLKKSSVMDGPPTWSNLLMNIITYLPCLFLEFIEMIRSGFNLKESASTNYMLIILAEIILIVLKFVLPIIFNSIINHNAIQLINTVIPLDTQTDKHFGYIYNKDDVTNDPEKYKLDTKLSYNYGISVWFYIHPKPLNGSPPDTSKSLNIISFHDDKNSTTTQVQIRYSLVDNTISIVINNKDIFTIMPNGAADAAAADKAADKAAASAAAAAPRGTATDASDNEKSAYKVANDEYAAAAAAAAAAKKSYIKWQRWNHVFININNGTMDVFLNNELVITQPNVMPSSYLYTWTVGKGITTTDENTSNNIIYGDVTNVVLYKKALSKDAISIIYDTFSPLETPLTPNI
jgi:hypothetical protein